MHDSSFKSTCCLHAAFPSGCYQFSFKSRLIISRDILKTLRRCSMNINLSSFLQWRPNIIMCRTIGWNFTYYYISILGKLYFFFNRKERWKIKKAVKTVFTGRKNSFELKSITRNVFRGVFFHYYEKFFNAYSTARTLENFVMNHMESEGMNAIKQGLAKGKGILLITTISRYRSSQNSNQRICGMLRFSRQTIFRQKSSTQTRHLI
jgi:hypothetical protein